MKSSTAPEPCLAPTVDAVLAAASAKLRDTLRLCFENDASRRHALSVARAEILKRCAALPAESDAADFANPTRFGDCLATLLGGSMDARGRRRLDALECRAWMLKAAFRYVRCEWSRATREGGLCLDLSHPRGDVLAHVDSRLVLRLTWADGRYLLAESMPGQPERVNFEVDPE